MKKETQALSVIISKDLYFSLKEFSSLNEFSMNQTISRAIKQYISTQPTINTIPQIENLTGLPPQLGPSQVKTALQESILSIPTPFPKGQGVIETPEEKLPTFAEKILDLWDDQQILCVYRHEEYEEIKEYLKTIKTNEPLLAIYNEAKRLTDIGFREQKECTISNFVEWAKEIVENQE